MLYNYESVVCLINNLNLTYSDCFSSFSSLNFILFFVVLVSTVVICFVFTLRHVFPTKVSSITGFENTFLTCVLLSSSVLLVLGVVDVPGVGLLEHTSNFTANKVFLALFLLTVPATFTLLVRQEQITTAFVGLNFLFLLLVVFFLINTESLIGMVMGYELVFLPSFLIMRKTVYSASAQSAYSVFTV